MRHSDHNGRLPTAAILLTGAELLDGRVPDTNGVFLSASLAEAGFRMLGLVIAPDDRSLIAEQLRRLLALEPRLLVVSGGLGSTHDDVTMAALADACNVELIEHAAAWEVVRARVQAVAARRGLDVDAMLRQARKQALLPVGAAMIAPAGTAPGARLDVRGTIVVCLPGVPAELRTMWMDCLPGLLGESGASAAPAVILRFSGVGEMQVAPLLEPYLNGPLEVSITAGAGEVAVRLAAADAEGERLMDTAKERLRATLPMYSADGRTVDQIIADELRRRRATVASAESCTGGLLAGRFTDLPGSSDYFVGGVVAYDNTVKTSALHVSVEILATEGAVSAACAAAMASGARARLRATYALSTTGIAGPGGGTPAKPVGLVYLGLAGPEGVRTVKHHFPGDRQAIRLSSVQAALHLLRETLESAR